MAVAVKLDAARLEVAGTTYAQEDCATLPPAEPEPAAAPAVAAASAVLLPATGSAGLLPIQAAPATLQDCPTPAPEPTVVASAPTAPVPSPTPTAQPAPAPTASGGGQLPGGGPSEGGGLDLPPGTISY
jgi:2-oxoglutarate dehydrogenase E2 component (dihydrolipoamide succinyltransferase)